MSSESFNDIILLPTNLKNQFISTSQAPPQVLLKNHQKMHTRLDTIYSVCGTQDGGWVVSGLEGDTYLYRIHHYDHTGKLKQQIPIPTLGAEDHDLEVITVEGQQYLVMSNNRSADIQLYSFTTGEMRPGYLRTNPETGEHATKTLCRGIKGELIACSGKGDITLFHITNSCVKVKKAIQSKAMINAKHVCHMKVPEHGKVMVSSTGTRYENGELQATSMATQQPIWILSGMVEGCLFNPRGLCVDCRGLLYVADGHNHRILVLQAGSGTVLQTLQPPELRGQMIRNLAWCNTSSQLIVQHDYHRISRFTVQHQ